MERKRLFIGKKVSPWNRAEMIKWAANNGYDAVVFSFGLNFNIKTDYIKLANRYDLAVEAGGHDLSMLIPRRLFFSNRSLFRMEHGKRKSKHHFCTTNPRVTSLIKENAYNIFSRYMKILPVPRVFHLLPDKGFEKCFCSCPACRAFTPAEQNIIAVSSAADSLAALDAEARLSFLDLGSDPNETGVQPRENMFALRESDLIAKVLK